MERAQPVIAGKGKLRTPHLDLPTATTNTTTQTRQLQPLTSHIPITRKSEPVLTKLNSKVHTLLAQTLTLAVSLLPLGESLRGMSTSMPSHQHLRCGPDPHPNANTIDQHLSLS